MRTILVASLLGLLLAPAARADDETTYATTAADCDKLFAGDQASDCKACVVKQGHEYSANEGGTACIESRAARFGQRAKKKIDEAGRDIGNAVDKAAKGVGDAVGGSGKKQ